MAFDEALAQRVREVLASQGGVTEKRMFGGIAFLLNGNVAVGVLGDRLMVRVGPEQYKTLLAEPHACEMDFTGKPLRGFVYVASEGLASGPALNKWVGHGTAFASSLPGK